MCVNKIVNKLYLFILFFFSISVLSSDIPALEAEPEVETAVLTGEEKERLIIESYLGKLNALNTLYKSIETNLTSLMEVVEKDLKPLKKGEVFDKEARAKSEELFKFHYGVVRPDRGTLYQSRRNRIVLDQGIIGRHIRGVKKVYCSVEKNPSRANLKINYLKILNAYQKGSEIRMQNQFYSIPIAKEFSAFNLSLIADVLITLEPLIEGLSDNQKANPADISHSLEEVSSMDFLNLFGQPTNQDSSKKRRRTNAIRVAVQEDPTNFLALNKGKIGRKVSSEAKVSRGANGLSEEEFSALYGNTEYEGPLEDVTSADVQAATAETTPAKNRVRRGQKIVAATARPSAQALPAPRLAEPQARVQVNRIRLTARTLETFKKMKAQPYSTEVSNQDYVNLIRTFIELNKGQNKYLKMVQKLTDKENHRNGEHNGDKDIGIGMSYIFTRNDGQSARLNIHFAHGRDAGMNKIPKEYVAKFMEPFKVFEIGVDDIDVP